MKKPAKSNRGGARTGAGRPPLEAGAETVAVTVRLLPQQRDKLKRLGGATWVRERIDRAREK